MKLSLCNLQGKEVVLDQGQRKAGAYSKIWNTQTAGAGLYLMILTTGNERKIVKAIVR
jgi:hypothetical protein